MYGWSALLTVTLLATATTVTQPHLFQIDFRGDLYQAGHAILHGVNPYQTSSLERQVAIVRAGGTPAPVASARYPPPILLAAVPLSLLPFGAAVALFMLVSFGAVFAALRLLGVRDWRCVAVAMLSWPMVSNLWIGNVSPLLLLGTAFAWRCRSQVRRLGVAVAATVVAKLILWPLMVWLLLTRRVRALALSGVLAAGGVLAAWAAIGFDGMTRYPHLLSDAVYVGQRRGSSIVATLLALGAPASVARAAALVVAGALLAAAWRARRLPDGDRRSFGLAVMAALAASPIVWTYYLVLLWVPIALLSPRFSLLWCLPLLPVLVPLYAPSPDLHFALSAAVVSLAIELVVVGVLCWPILAGDRREAPLSDSMAAAEMRL